MPTLGNLISRIPRVLREQMAAHLVEEDDPDPIVDLPTINGRSVEEASVFLAGYELALRRVAKALDPTLDVGVDQEGPEGEQCPGCPDCGGELSFLPDSPRQMAENLLHDLTVAAEADTQMVQERLVAQVDREAPEDKMAFTRGFVLGVAAHLAVMTKAVYGLFGAHDD